MIRRQIHLKGRHALIPEPRHGLSYQANTSAQGLNRRCQGHEGFWSKTCNYFCFTQSVRAAPQTPGRRGSKETRRDESAVWLIGYFVSS